MPKKYTHYHKLRRFKYANGAVIYFCTENCEYKASPGLLVGKISLCNRCGEPFRHTAYSLKLREPHCPKCHKHNSSFSISSEEGLVMFPVNDSNDESNEAASVATAESRRSGLALKNKLENRPAISRVQYEPIEIRDDDGEEEFL